MKDFKRLNYIWLSFFLCFIFAIGSNYFMGHASKEQMIYGSHDPLRIGACYMTMNNPFYSIIDEEIERKVKANGDILITLDPALSVNKQKEQLRYLMNQDIDALILTPVDFDSLNKELKMFYEKEIPVIVVDTEVKDLKYVTYSVASDNYNAGVLCAKDMMSRYSSARIVLMEHTDTNSGKERIQGFLDTISGLSSYTIVYRSQCEGQLERSMPIMEDFLDTGVEFDVVMCLNDPAALGVMAAMENRGVLEDKYIYGIDGTPEIKRLVLEGRNVATVEQSPRMMGKKAVRALYKILNHESVQKENKIDVSLINADSVSRYSVEEWS